MHLLVRYVLRVDSSRENATYAEFRKFGDVKNTTFFHIAKLKGHSIITYNSLCKHGTFYRINIKYLIQET